MTRLLALQHRLQDTGAALARLEQEFASTPADEGLALSLRSMERRFAAQQQEFSEVAASVGVDVCKYRLFADVERYTLRAASASWSEFQRLFSIVYSALTTGPKDTSKVSMEVARATDFSVAYTFAGSLGLALTLPNEAQLVGETELDKTMEVVFGMAKAHTAGEVLAHVKVLGAGPVRVLYRWADSQTRAGLGADIRWQRKQQVRAQLIVQQPELARLQQIIAQTGTETTEELQDIGRLIGADIDDRWFHMHLHGLKQDIKGTFVDAIKPEDKTSLLGKDYLVVLTKKTIPQYAMDEDKIEYVLNSIAPVTR